MNFESFSRRVNGSILRASLTLCLVGDVCAITYDQWATAAFGNSEMIEAAPGMDPDGDGMINLREYAFMLDPNAAEPNPEEGGLLLHSDNLHYLYLRFPRRTDATDLIYEVRSEGHVAALCDGSVPYLWDTGTTQSQVGLIATDTTTTPHELTVIDPSAPLEGVSRGFVQLFIVLASTEAPMDFVNVGDPGNAPDGNYGSVDYEFEMAEFETTNAQYVEFLNAIAATDRTDHPLYNDKMAGARGGIRRIGTPGSYTYVVKPNMGDKPVNFLRFWSACRFCNWLHNGKPMPRCRTMSADTTEDGAYDLTNPAAVAANTVSRKPGAQYFIPSENEWYKAAYYDPTRAGSDKYWNYGTASDSLPVMASADLITGAVSNSGGNVANYARGADWDEDGDGTLENSTNNTEDGNVTSCGSGPGCRSYYGAADMTGNVGEWTEATMGTRSIWARIERGGHWNISGNLISSSARIGQSPLIEGGHLGFRVARVAP